MFMRNYIIGAVVGLMSVVALSFIRTIPSELSMQVKFH